MLTGLKLLASRMVPTGTHVSEAVVAFDTYGTAVYNH